jgi:integrase/recombinase XerD
MDVESTLQHFLADCEIRGLTRETVAWYRKRLCLFGRKLAEVAGITRVEDVTIAHLRLVVQYFMTVQACANNPRRPTEDHTLSPFTVRGYVRAIKVFFRWCYHEEVIGTNPSVRLVQPKAPENLVSTFTVEHIEKMLASCPLTTPRGFRDFVILLVFFDTGMRISELCGLCLADIQGSYVKVTGKGRKEREIGMHPHVARLLWRYVNTSRGVPSEGAQNVFLGRGGHPLHAAGVDALLGRVKRASGVSGVRVSAHTFRHTFAKFYLERGGALFDLSREMGHSSVQVTEVYLRDYRSAQARKNHRKHSPVDLVKLPTKRRTRTDQG